MHPLRGTMWGPQPLPELLRSQLAAHGFTSADASFCARQITDRPGPVAVASLFVDLGACKFLEGDIDGALASWRHAIAGEHDAAAARALLNLGLLYEHLQLHDRALGVFASVAQRAVAPYQASAVMAAARCHQAAGDSDAAMESMARLAQSEMTHGSTPEILAESLYGLGEIAAEAGRFDRAERAWRAASASAPSVPQQAAAGRLMALLLDQGHDEEMLDLLDEQPVAAVTVHAPAVIERVEALHRVGSDEQAAILALTIDGDALAPGDRFRLADVRRQVGLINEAIDELEVLLTHADADVQQRAAFSLGEIYRSHTMHDPAVTMYERALHEADDFWAPKAALALGDMWADMGDREKALEHWTYATSSTVVTVSDAAAERLDATFSQASSVVDENAVEPQVVSLGDVEGDDADLTKAVMADEILAEPQVVLLGDVEGDDADVTEVVMADEILTEPQVVLLDEVEGDDADLTEAAIVDEILAEPQVVLLSDVDEPAPIDETLAAPQVVLHADTDGDEFTLAEAMIDDQNLAKPQVVVLAALEEFAADGKVDAAPIVEPARTDARLLATSLQPTVSVFRTLSDPNPYAALAPEGLENDVAPSSRNPYAELAPNFDGDQQELPSDVEPGDWESILEEWPRDTEEAAEAPVAKKKSSSAFSRYT